MWSQVFICSVYIKVSIYLVLKVIQNTMRWTLPFPDIISRMLGCRRTVLRLGEDIAIDLADLSKCSMLA